MRNGWLGFAFLVACQGSASKTDPLAVPASAAASSAGMAPTASASATASATATASAPAPDWITAQHILIAYKGANNAPKNVTRSKAEAKTLAEKVRDEAKTAPFEDLVAKYSEDPGSKDRLGSVGKFTRDKMTKAFSDAAFALKVDQVSDVVESPFGFHVIKRNQ